MTPIDRTPLKFQLNALYIKDIAANFFYIVSLLLTVCALTLWSSQSIAATTDSAPRDPMKFFFHLSFNDLEDELQIAIDENKSGIFIMFSDKDCPWCSKMKLTVLNRPDVQQYYREHFRVLAVDVRSNAIMQNFDGSELTQADFSLKQYRVRATPVFMFFDTSGKVTMRFTGITRSVKEFLWLGEFVVSGEYKKTNFTKYKRHRTEQDKNISGENPH